MLDDGDCLLPPQTPGSLNGIKGIEAEESPASAKM